MKRQISQAVLLFAIFRSFSCFEQIVEEYGSTKIGEKCERDRNCIKNAYCRAQMACVCDQYYSPSPDRATCIASAGLICSNDITCQTMTNAECKQGVCACKDSYILDTKNSSNCISRPSTVGDRCQRNDECQDTLGRAMCINGRCQCITSYHFANETNQCVQTRFLYNSCTTDYECVGFDNRNVLRCKNGECICKEDEAGCSKGSSYAVVGILAMLSLFLQRLI